MEILAVHKFGSLGPNNVLNSMGGFNFGGMVRNHHTYIHAVESLANFNLAVERHTAKLPNLFPPPHFPAMLYILVCEAGDAKSFSDRCRLRGNSHVQWRTPLSTTTTLKDATGCCTHLA